MPDAPSTAAREVGQADESIGRRDLGRWATAVGRLLLRAFAWLERTIRRYWDDGSLSVSALVTTALGALVLVGSQAVVAETYEGVVESDGVAGLDRPVLRAMLSARSPGLDSAITHFTDVGGKVGGPVVAVVVTLALTALWRRRTPVVLMAIAAAGSVLMTVTGKELTGRLRPPQSMAVPPYESSASFPSGHTLNFTVIMGITAYLLLVWLHRTWTRVLAVLVTGTMAVAMGLSRVYLGHHWLTDVVAAWFLGIGWVVAVVTVHRLVVTVRRTRRSAAEAAENQRRRSPFAL